MIFKIILLSALAVIEVTDYTYRNKKPFYGKFVNFNN